MVALPSSPYPDHQAPYVESSAGQSLYHQGQSETETRSLPPPTADRRSPSSPSLVGWQLQPIQQQQQQPSSCSPPSSRDVYGSQAYSMLPQEPLTTHPQQVLAAAYPSPSTQLVPSAYLPQVMNSQGMAAIVSPPSAPSGGAYTLQNPLPHMSSSPHVIVSTPHQGCESSVLQNQPSGTTPPHSLPVPHRPQDSFLPTRSNFLSQPAGPPMPSPPLPFPVSSQGGATLSSPTRPPLPPNTMVLAAHPPQIQESFFPSVYQGQETPLLPTGGVRSSFPEKIRDENDDVNGKRTFDEKARQGLVGGEEEGVRLGIQGPHVVSSPLHPPSDVGYAGLPYSSVQRFSGTEKRSFRASSPTHCFRGGRPESYDLITEPLRGRHGNPLRPVTSPEPPIARKAVYPIPTPGQTTLAQRILRDLRSRLCGNSKEETEFLISKYLHQGRLATPHSQQQERSQFSLLATPDEILTILEAVKCIFSVETTVVEVNLPAKIFGDLHGHLADLFEFFRSFGWPDEVDKTTRQYEDFLFLGDYVDRGECSLEVILILFALKILFPSRVFLLRGNHEDRTMNEDYGFAAEIENKLGVYGGDLMKARLVWQCANDVFDFLPLGAHLPAARIFCLHGCLGNSIRLIDDLRGLTRPIQVTGIDIDRKALPDVPSSSSSPFPNEETEKICRVLDCLWSDPERPPDNKEDVAGPDSPRGAHAIRSSAEFIREFLKRNQLHLLIRAHECVLPGYCYDLDGGCLTLFSASNYCGRYQNDGAALHVYREEELVEGGEEDESPHGAGVPRQPRSSDHITWHILLVEYHSGNEERSNGSKTHQFSSSCVPPSSPTVTRPSPPCSPLYPPLPCSSHPSTYPIPSDKNQQGGEPSLVDFSSPLRGTQGPTQPRQPLPFPTHAPSSGIPLFGSYQPDLSMQSGSPPALAPSAVQGLSPATPCGIGVGVKKSQGGENDHHSLPADHQYAELARLAAEAVNSPVSGRSPSPSPLPPFPSSSEAALLLSSALAASSAQATKSYSSPSPVGLPPSTLLASPSSPRVVAPASGSSQVLSSTSCPQTASGVYHPGPPSVVVTPPASPHQADGLQVPGPLVEIPSEFLRSAGSASDAHDSFPIHSNPPIPSLSPGNTRIDSPRQDGEGFRQVMMEDEGERQQGGMNSNPVFSSCRVTPRDEFPENDNPSLRSPPLSSSSLPNPFRQNHLQPQQPTSQDNMHPLGYSHNHNTRGSRGDEIHPSSHGYPHRPEPLSPSVAAPRAPSAGNRDASLSSPFLRGTRGSNPCPDDSRNTPRGGEATTSHPSGSFPPPGSPHWRPHPHTPQSTMKDRVNSASPHHSRHTSPTGPPAAVRPDDLRRARDEGGEEEERRCSPRSPHWRAVHGILSPTSRPEHNRFPTRNGVNNKDSTKDDEDGLKVDNLQGHSTITRDGPSSSSSSPRVPTHRRPRRRSLPLLCDFDGQPFPLPSDLRPQETLKSLSPRPSSSSLVGGAEPHRGRREEGDYHAGNTGNNHASITAHQPAYVVVGGPGEPSSPPAPPVRRTPSRTEVGIAPDHARLLGHSAKSLRGDDLFASSPPFPYGAPQSHRLHVPSRHAEEESVYSFGGQEGNNERRRRRGTEGDQEYNGQLLGPSHLPLALTREKGAEGSGGGARRTMTSSSNSSSSRTKVNPWTGRETRAEHFGGDGEFDSKAQDTSRSEKEKKGRRKWSGFFSRRGTGNKGGGGKEEDENPDEEDAVLAAFSKARRRSNPR